MRRLLTVAVLLAGCGNHGFALDVNVAVSCLQPTSLGVVVSASGRADKTQTIDDAAAFLAGSHQVVVLVADGIHSVTVAVTAFDGARQLARNAVTVAIKGPGKASQTLTLDGACSDGGTADASEILDAASADAGDSGLADAAADAADDLAYVPSCPGARCVFVTSMALGANLGGLDGADTTCTTLAHNAGLHGQYKAWVSSTTMSASVRLSHSTIPYHLVDGTLVANDWTDLTSGALRHAIDLTESGTAPPGTSAGVSGGHDVWTDTLPNGNLNFASSTCGDWTGGGAGSLGSNAASAASSMYWTYMSNISACSGSATLYCFEQ